MNTGSLCRDCKGKGLVEIKNVYDDSTEYDTCDSCFGTGMADDDDGPRFIPTKKRGPVKEFD